MTVDSVTMEHRELGYNNTDKHTIQAQVTSFSVMCMYTVRGKLLSWTFGGGYSLLILKKDLARVTACRTLPFGGRTHTSRERAHGFDS